MNEPEPSGYPETGEIRRPTEPALPRRSRLPLIASRPCRPYFFLSRLRTRSVSSADSTSAWPLIASPRGFPRRSQPVIVPSLFFPTPYSLPYPPPPPPPHTHPSP